MKKCLLLVATFALAASFGVSGEITKLDRPIAVKVPFTAGSAMDVRARIIMKHAEPLLGNTATIENKAGAAGIVGTTEFLTQRSRNHTMLFFSTGGFSSLPIYNKTTFTIDDIQPLVSVDVEAFGMYACPERTGIKSLDDVKAFGKRIKYATGAPGSIGHISCATALLFLGIDGDHIVTSGASVSLTECLGGHNDISFAGTGLAKGFVENGRLAPLFTFSPEDYTGYKGMVVPSLKTLGIDYSYANLTFFGMRKDTKPEVVDFVQSVIEKVLASPECQAELKAAGVEQFKHITRDEISQYVKNEMEFMREIGPKIGLTPQR